MITRCMKRAILLALLAVFVVGSVVGCKKESATPSNGWTNKATVTVYVTRTGVKYHRNGCRYLSKSRIPMPLKEAKVRYTACSVCKPPQ